MGYLEHLHETVLKYIETKNFFSLIHGFYLSNLFDVYKKTVIELHCWYTFLHADLAKICNFHKSMPQSNIRHFHCNTITCYNLSFIFDYIFKGRVQRRDAMKSHGFLQCFLNYLFNIHSYFYAFIWHTHCFLWNALIFLFLFLFFELLQDIMKL